MADRIPLSEMLAELRKELLKAQQGGKDAPLRFVIEDVEIEVQIGTTKEAGGGGGVSFWVYNADAKISVEDLRTQKLTLKLKVVGPDGKAPVLISDTDNLPR
jgi:hypothetical protein